MRAKELDRAAERHWRVVSLLTQLADARTAVDPSADRPPMRQSRMRNRLRRPRPDRS